MGNTGNIREPIKCLQYFEILFTLLICQLWPEHVADYYTYKLFNNNE